MASHAGVGVGGGGGGAAATRRRRRRTRRRQGRGEAADAAVARRRQGGGRGGGGGGGGGGRGGGGDKLVAAPARTPTVTAPRCRPSSPPRRSARRGDAASVAASRSRPVTDAAPSVTQRSSRVHLPTGATRSTRAASWWWGRRRRRRPRPRWRSFSVPTPSSRGRTPRAPRVVGRAWRRERGGGGADPLYGCRALAARRTVTSTSLSRRVDARDAREGRGTGTARRLVRSRRARGPAAARAAEHTLALDRTPR